MSNKIDQLLEDLKPAVIKVFGIGGGGGNALQYMYEQQIEGVDFVTINTDSQALMLNSVPAKLPIGKLGAGGDPEKGRQAAEDHEQDIKDLLKDTEMLFLTTGLGGGTGTGATPVIARIAHEMGILTVAVVTVPFSIEGQLRRSRAQEGLQNLKEYVDATLVVNNDKLPEIYPKLAVNEAFNKANDVLLTGVRSIAEIITKKGIINADINDIRSAMEQSGAALMGFGKAEGDNRALEATMEALASPLLSNSDIKGAKHVLLNIRYGNDEALTMEEFSAITNYVTDRTGVEDTNLKPGCGPDDSLGSAVSVTIIATGFDTKEEKQEEPTAQQKEVKEPIIEEPIDVKPTPAQVETPQQADKVKAPVVDVKPEPVQDNVQQEPQAGVVEPVIPGVLPEPVAIEQPSDVKVLSLDDDEQPQVSELEKSSTIVAEAPKKEEEKEQPQQAETTTESVVDATSEDEDGMSIRIAEDDTKEGQNEAEKPNNVSPSDFPGTRIGDRVRIGGGLKDRMKIFQAGLNRRKYSASMEEKPAFERKMAENKKEEVPTSTFRLEDGVVEIGSEEPAILKSVVD